MDQIKIGKFIAQMRKEQSLTQRQLRKILSSMSINFFYENQLSRRKRFFCSLLPQKRDMESPLH